MFSNCPDPDLTNELSFDEREVRGPPLGEEEGAVLISSREEYDELRDDRLVLNFLDEEIVTDTDFDTAVVLFIQVKEASGLDILGVGREEETTVRVHTCDQEARSDVPHARFLHIWHEGQIPENVRVTHWEDGEARDIASPSS